MARRAILKPIGEKKQVHSDTHAFSATTPKPLTSMAIDFDTPKGQRWLINIGKYFNRSIDERGLCHGVAGSGIQALIARDYTTLNNRWHTLAKMVEPHPRIREKIFKTETEFDELKSVLINVEKALENRKNWKKYVEENIAQFRLELAKKLEDKNIEDEIAKRIKELDKENRRAIEIAILFSNIDIYSKPVQYRRLFPLHQQPRMIVGFPALALLSPVVMDKKADMAFPEAKITLEDKKAEPLTELAESQMVTRPFIGFYSHSELSTHFGILKKILDNQRKEFATEQQDELPFAMSIGSINHSITLGYNIKTGNWILIDANNLPGKEVPQHLLANYLIDTFSFNFNTNSQLALETRIYCAEDRRPLFKNIINNWQQTENFKKIHEVTLAKAREKDDSAQANVSLLHLAAIKGDVETAKKLISLYKKHGLDLDEMDNEGRTALHSAAQNGHLKIIKMLLHEDGIHESAEIDSPTFKSGSTALDFAYAYNQLEVVKYLLKAGANPTIDCNPNVANLNESMRGCALIWACVTNEAEQYKMRNEINEAFDEVYEIDQSLQKLIYLEKTPPADLTDVIFQELQEKIEEAYKQVLNANSQEEAKQYSAKLRTDILQIKKRLVKEQKSEVAPSYDSYISITAKRIEKALLKSDINLLKKKFQHAMSTNQLNVLKILLNSSDNLNILCKESELKLPTHDMCVHAVLWRSLNSQAVKFKKRGLSNDAFEQVHELSKALRKTIYRYNGPPSDLTEDAFKRLQELVETAYKGVYEAKTQDQAKKCADEFREEIAKMHTEIVKSHHAKSDKTFFGFFASESELGMRLAEALTTSDKILLNRKQKMASSSIQGSVSS